MEPNQKLPVEFVGVSKLRTLTETALSELQRPLIVMPHYLDKFREPIAVVIPYRQYLAFGGTGYVPRET